MKPGGRSKRPVPLLPSTAPFTVAEKVSTTTAGRELCEQDGAVSRTNGSVGKVGAPGGKGTRSCPVPNYPARCSSRELWPAPAWVRHTGKLQVGRRQTATRQTDNGEEKTGHGPCHLTEAASLAAVSPGSWAPPTTSEASAGCNIKCQQGIRHGVGCHIQDTSQERSVQVREPGWPRNVSRTIQEHPAGQTSLYRRRLVRKCWLTQG